MSRPRITVITPCLNQALFIERTLCSVLDQGYEHLEYLVVDGGSTDGTAELIRHYQDQLAWWTTRPDEGPADAINRALRHATGEIVAVLPGDDVYLPGALEKIAAVMAEADGPGWVIAQGQRIGEHDEPLGSLTCAAPRGLAQYLRHESPVAPACATFFRRDLLRRHGQFDHSLSLCFEYDYHCRLLADGVRPRVIDASVAGRREHARQRTSRYVCRQGVEQLQVARRHTGDLAWRDRLAVWRSCDERERIYSLAIAESRGDQARRFLWRRIMRRPWWAANHAVRHALRRGIEHPAPPLEGAAARWAA